MNGKRNEKVEMDLKTRKMVAQGVIKNAKEIVMSGLNGREVKKIIALVPLNLIKTDHEKYQREEKHHVVTMAKEWDDEQCTVLLVNYRSNEGWFYVIDGQHRVAAAKLIGIEYLACEIYIDLSVKEEAKRYLEYNTGTKSLNPFDTFKANICWGEPVDTAIKAICDEYGVNVIERRRIKTLKSVPVARAIYKGGGVDALKWIFKLIEDVHWEDFKESYSADVLLGLYAVYVKYKDNLKQARRNLIDFMAKSDPRELYGLGDVNYPSLGHTTKVRLTMCEIAGSVVQKDEMIANGKVVKYA